MVQRVSTERGKPLERPLHLPLLISIRSSFDTCLVDITHLPEEHEELLVELNLLGGPRQVGLDERVVQQSRQPTQDEVEILEKQIQEYCQFHKENYYIPSKTKYLLVHILLSQSGFTKSSGGYRISV